MSLAEKFKTVQPAQSGLPCGLAKIMDSMDSSDKETLHQVLFEDVVGLQGKRLSNTKIYQILVEEGYNIAPSSIAQHRRKQCRCFVGAAARQKDSK
jgi:hypothetical protein